jgi:hypothetical protein
METQNALREIAKVRMHFQINNRLRLESLAALSKTFRDHGATISDELLASIVPAVPEELPGESSAQSLSAAGKPPMGKPLLGKPPMGKPALGKPPTGRPPKGRLPKGRSPKGRPSKKR